MTKRIHVLEDDNDISYIIEYLLKDEGFEIQVSSTFAELKQKLKDGLPDLFILDVMLPDGNGAEICADLKNDMFTKHIPVIVMSASAANQKMSEQALADDYISKPFDIDFVLGRINRILNRQSSPANKVDS